MHRRVGTWFVILALIFSVGGHWGVLQVTAWVGMAADFCKTDDLSTAITKTFDGRNPCELCKFVSEGKESEQKSQTKLDSKKLDCFATSAGSFYFPPLIQTSFSSLSSLSVRLEAPPTPPPLLA